MKKISSAEFRVTKTFHPIITTATLGILLAGCGSTALDIDDGDDAMMGSSASQASVMNNSSSTASDVMMKNSDTMRSEAVLQMYKDGTYAADGAYQSPAGGEAVHISLTVINDVVTDAMFTGDATHKKSIAMQAAFGEGFKEHVVGKSLEEVSVGVVNGSSLTAKGFMNAVSTIKAEAKAY